MTGPDAHRRVSALGMTHARFAGLARMHPQALQKWKQGSEPSGAAVVLIRLFEDRPDLIDVVDEINRIDANASAKKAQSGGAMNGG